MGVQALVFRAGAHLAALAVEQVTEVMRPLPVEALAGAPPYVRGICVLRGQPVPVVDLAVLLGGERPVGQEPRFVGVRTGAQPAAVVVDSVVGVRDLPLDQMVDLSSVVGATGTAVGAVGAEPLLLLSAGRVVPDAVWAAWADAA